MNRVLKTTGLAILGAAAAGAVALLLVRDQISRNRRELFSPYAIRRLAALGHIAREPASVDDIMLLRDFLAWEPRRLLQNRARVILQRMEAELRAGEGPAGAAVL